MRCATILALISAAAAVKLIPDLSLVADPPSLARPRSPLRSPGETCVEQITFHGGQTHAYSNLGGLGPDTDKPPELRYRDVGFDHKTGKKLDLVFRNDTQYQTTKPESNGVIGGTHVGQISVAVGTDVKTTMSFFEHDTTTPVYLDLVKLTFCDVDHFSLARAEIYTLDVDAFYTVNDEPDFTFKFKYLDGNDLDPAMILNENVTTENGRISRRYYKDGGGQFRVKVTSANPGFGCDNPRDFNDLNTITYKDTAKCQCPADKPDCYYNDFQDLVVDQAKRCFAFELKDSSSTRFALKAGTDGVWTGKSRHAFISGASTYFNHEVPCPTPATTEPPTTTEPPETTEEPGTTSVEATPAPTPAPTAAITGDPHVTNVDGQRFDIVRAGMHDFLRLPRLAPADAAAASASAEPLLHVMGRVEAMQDGCEFPFVVEVLVSGRLLGPVGSLRFSTNGSVPNGSGATFLSINGSEVGSQEFARQAKSVATVLVPKQPVTANTGSTIRRQTFLAVKLHLGHVNMSIDWVHRSVPTGGMVNHLNFDVSNLAALSKEFDVDIGGILGRDDHTLATTVGPECAVHTSDLIAASGSRELTASFPTSSVTASL